MNSNRESQSDPLDSALKQWRVDAPLPPRFQEQIWNRIARAQANPEATLTFWTFLQNLMEANLPRPKFAYSYVATLLIVGVISGAWAGQHEANRLNAALGSKYVQSIDPYHQVGESQ